MRAPAAPAHEADQQARSVCEGVIADRAIAGHTLRACGSGRPLQPPSPCRRARPRSAGSPRRRLTGLSAALRHKVPLAAGVLPGWRGMRHPWRMKSRARPTRLMSTGRPRILRPASARAAPAAQLLAVPARSADAALPARHPWLAPRLGKFGRCARSCASASATPRAARLIVARSQVIASPALALRSSSRSCRRSRGARRRAAASAKSRAARRHRPPRPGAPGPPRAPPREGQGFHRSSFSRRFTRARQRARVHERSQSRD